MPNQDGASIRSASAAHLGGRLPSLRASAVFPAVRRGIAVASGATFRVVHFAVQANHVHLVVECPGAAGLARGVQGLAVRIARAVNRALGRSGRVWGDRYHARALPTPREVRRALAYVLLNARKHGAAARGVDACSSGAWFDGWRERLPAPSLPAPVARARTWLLGVGWRRWGLISLQEVPGPRPPARRRVARECPPGRSA